MTQKEERIMKKILTKVFSTASRVRLFMLSMVFYLVYAMLTYYIFRRGYYLMMNIPDRVIQTVVLICTVILCLLAIAFPIYFDLAIVLPAMRCPMCGCRTDRLPVEENLLFAPFRRRRIIARIIARLSEPTCPNCGHYIGR